MNLLIVSDSAEIAEALERFIFSALGATVVARTHPLDDAAEYVARFQPETALFYLKTLDAERLAAIRAARSASATLKILTIANADELGAAQAAFRAGANGYLCAMPTREQLLDALGELAQSRPTLDPRFAASREGRRLRGMIG